MRPFLILMSLFVLSIASGPAHAGPGSDLAQLAESIRLQADERASTAASHPAAPADPLDMDDAFLTQLEQFSLQAIQLSRHLQTHDGAMDLQCIFRGMSEDSALSLERLDQASTSGEQARIYRSIADLMRDATEIGPDADAAE